MTVGTVILIAVCYGAEADVMKHNDIYIDWMLFIIIDVIMSVYFVIMGGIIRISILKLSLLFFLSGSFLHPDYS